jgi:uncharacterized protein (TIGR02646 family)
MKFIQKAPEPDTFAQWKQQANPDWQPNWENFQKPEKVIVHHALIAEQGHICCYCGQRITKANSHIEHFQPRTDFPSLSLSYGNFLASCPGYPENETTKSITKLPQEFCGQKKGAWYDRDLTISPIQPYCSSYFRYTRIGELLLPTQDLIKLDAAKTTIENLGLNHPKLVRLREAAIDGVLQDLETLTDEDIQQLVQNYDRPDSSGKYTPFCAAVIYQLEQFLA